ncbi:hypothetical protein [Georgenia sunbinii]|uniref:hypothetical protein n=1 Tax=Georgenia sunbinii TaxID=3117728 RepID=UPI002F268252
MSTSGPDKYTVITETSGPRTGTIVWGAVLAMLGLGCLAVGLGLSLDLQLSLIVLLVVAGVGLLVKALLPRNDTPSP